MGDRRAFWFVLLVAAALPYFVNLGATSIIDANEAFYTETPREMVEAGDYLNSTFNYEPRFNKPPLSYWVVAASYHVCGVSLTAARLPIALGALVLIGTAFALGRLAFSTRAAWLAALTLAATPRFLLFARRIIIDMYSAMFLGLTLLLFALAETDVPRRRRWLAAMYVATGLGVLTKGPVALVVPALVFPLYLLAAGRLSTLRSLMLPAGGAIVAAIVVPYYALLYAEHGWTYITTFLVRENLARYAEGIGAPNRGPLFYLPVVFTDLYFPWSLLLPVALALVPWRRAWSWRGWWAGGGAGAVTAREVRLLLGLWIAVIVVFFSLSRAQQDLYVLPYIVAAAALVGGLMDGLIGRALSPALRRWTLGSLGGMLAVLVLLGVFAAWFIGGAGHPVHVAGARPAGVLLSVGAIGAGVLLARRAAMWSALTAVATMVAVLWLLILVGLPDFERYKPVPQLAKIIEARPVPAAHVGTYRVATPSLVFYLRRHVDQMFDETQLAGFFQRGGDAYCVIYDEDYEAVRAIPGLAVRVAGEVPRLTGQVSDFIRPGPRPRLLLITNVRE